MVRIADKPRLIWYKSAQNDQILSKIYTPILGYKYSMSKCCLCMMLIHVIQGGVTLQIKKFFKKFSKVLKKVIKSSQTWMTTFLTFEMNIFI